MVVAGLFALLYVGGLQAYIRGRVELRSGTPTVQVRRAPALELSPSPVALPSPTPTPSPPLPVLNSPQGEASPVIPTPVVDPQWRSAVTRIVIPKIGVDSDVIEVGWRVREIAGRQMAVWDVAKFAVGHHQGSGNPGEGTNIVMAGHVAGFAGAVFLDLIDVQPGDEVFLEGDEGQYLYVVEEILLFPEETVSLAERMHNARYMNPTEEEQLTLITCWPPWAYDHRLIVLARPYRADPFPRPDLVAD
jgi:sortase A